MLLRSLYRLMAPPVVTSRLEQIDRLLYLLRPRETASDLLRFGTTNDGGYLLPASARWASHLFSAGIDDNCDFELEFDELGAKVHAIDASITRLPVTASKVKFEPLFLGHVTETNVVTLEEWTKSYLGGNGILKLDIEGAEYSCLLGASSNVISKFEYLIVEIYGLERIASYFGVSQTLDLIKKLSVTHHLVHVHGNNVAPEFNFGGNKVPVSLECTFVRRDSREFTTSSPPFRRIQYQEGKDQPCIPGLPEVQIVRRPQ